jgi:outer membrane protein assembly factor BamB
MDRSVRLVAAPMVVVALLLAMVSGGAALAAPRVTFTLTPDSGPPTAAFEARLTRLPANSAIIIHWDEIEIGRGSADSRGALILILHVPKTASPGLHELFARSAEGGDVSRLPFLVRTDWLQFGFSENVSGSNPLENVLLPPNVNGLAIRGRFATGGSITGSPVACGGKLVVGSGDGKVYGFDVGAFTDPWLFQTRGAIVGTPAAIPPGPCLVGVGSSDGTFYAIDAATGKAKWKSAGGAPITSPALLYLFDPQPDPPGRFLVGDQAGFVRALDEKGRRLWSTQLDGAVTGAAFWRSVPVDPMNPSVLQLDPGNRIVVTTSIGNVYGLDPSTGAILVLIRLGASIGGGPAVFSFVRPPEPEVPQVVVGDAAGTIHALFADDLSEAWSFRTGGPITTTPAIEDPDEIGDPGIIVASGDGSVYKLLPGDRSVSVAWTAAIGAALNVSPSLAGGVLYLGADDSRLRALDAASGRTLFTSDEITDTRSTPIVVDGQVFVGTSHGELVGFYLPL